MTVRSGWHPPVATDLQTLVMADGTSPDVRPAESDRTTVAHQLAEHV